MTLIRFQGHRPINKRVPVKRVHSLPETAESLRPKLLLHGRREHNFSVCCLDFRPKLSIPDPFYQILSIFAVLTAFTPVFIIFQLVPACRNSPNDILSHSCFFYWQKYYEHVTDLKPLLYILSWSPRQTKSSQFLMSYLLPCRSQLKV